ncbi:MAG: Hsp70 family protein, partial [Ureaplasma sp.]|nr:Hsp70 family protein [Ureaplasma sp.]
NVDIKIVQGERLVANQNKLLGRFQLNDIEPAPAGVPQIEISFSIDINGIMSISARDLRTNKQNSITITNSSNLDNNQIQRMYREAQEYKEKDEQFKEQADIRNKVDKITIELNEIISKSKFLKNKDKKIQQKINDIKSLITKGEYAMLEIELEELEKILIMLMQFDESAHSNVSSSKEDVSINSDSHSNSSYTNEDNASEIDSYTNDNKPNISYENIQEAKYEEITNLENSSIVEEDYIPNIQEINDEPKNFDKSEFISHSLEVEIISDASNIENSKIIEVEVKNIRKAKKKDISITAIKIEKSIENQKANLQKICEEQK